MEGGWTARSNEWRDDNVLACVLLLSFLKTWLHELLWYTTQ
jgi:hypothetical protein